MSIDTDRAPICSPTAEDSCQATVYFRVLLGAKHPEFLEEIIGSEIERLGASLQECVPTSLSNAVFDG